MPVTKLCPLGNIPGSGMGMGAGQGVGQNAGLFHMGAGAGHGAHLGAGAGGGLLSCPAGSGLLPGLHAQGAMAGSAKGMVAAMGANGAMVQAPSAASKAVIAGGIGAGSKGVSLGLGIGLGLWGPVVLAAASAAGAVYFWRRFHEGRMPTEDESEMSEALSSR